MNKCNLGILLLMLFGSLSCKILQKKDPQQISDCELISKIINQVGIIDEPLCNESIVIVNDTSKGLSDFFRRELNNTPIGYQPFKYGNCHNFKFDCAKNYINRPTINREINADSNMSDPMYSFEKDQCYEVRIGSLIIFKEYYALSIGIINSFNSYYINFIFNLDQNSNLTDIKMVSYKPNKSKPDYKDLSKKYPTLKSKYWESFGLPDK